MSRWLDALKAKSRISASRDKADSIDKITLRSPAAGTVSIESIVSAPAEMPHAGDLSPTAGRLPISETRDTADAIDTIPASGLDAQNFVNKVRCVRDFKSAEASPVQPDHVAAPPPRDMLREILGEETFRPPLKVPRDSGLTEIPPQGMMCATCGGCAWRQHAPGATYLCDEPTCADYPAVSAIRIPVPTRFLFPPGIPPHPNGECEVCHGARWGHSPSVAEAFGFDGWRRWHCLSCHRQEMQQRPDVIVFTGEADTDRR